MKTSLILMALIGFLNHASADEMGASTTYFDSQLNYAPQDNVSVAETELDELDRPYNPNPDRLLFKFGPGWSSLSQYGTAESQKSFRRTSVSLAAEYEHPLTSEFSMATGLNYVEKGMDYVDFNSSVRLSYLVLPLLAKFNFQLNDRNRVSFAVGPYLAYALKAAELRNNGVEWMETAAENTSSLDFGTRFGFDYDFLIKSDFSFLVGVAYDLGLANLREASVESQSTRAFMANIGIGIKI